MQSNRLSAKLAQLDLFPLGKEILDVQNVKLDPMNSIELLARLAPQEPSQRQQENLIAPNVP